jgi:CBS domain-containing protein
MNNGISIKIELHCHSLISDGLLPPETIAQECAKAGVRFASLTDHNTTAGLDKFESSCRHYGIGFIPGIELTSSIGNTEIHLLGYGFDRTSDAFTSILAPVGGGILPAVEIIPRIHRSGGIAVLAHPFASESENEKIHDLIKNLAHAGLDGVEVFHHSATDEQQKFLQNIAKIYGLAVSGGSDFHAQGENSLEQLGIQFPLEEWLSFREILFSRFQSTYPAVRPEKIKHPDISGTDRKNLSRLITWMVIPAMTVMLLFLVELFVFFLPGYEKELVNRKRETIKELTNTVWSMLDEAQNEIEEGADLSKTQQHAAEQIRSLRYGPEGKDYFWVQDLTPKMIVHPYRPDLDGQDIGNFTDSRGVKIFSVFAEIVRKNKEGYADYVWQWKDDPLRQEAKESYIRLFEPWGWVIGTGIYLHDVSFELSMIRNRFIYTVSIIAAILIGLLLIMIRGGLLFEKQRRVAQKRLQESNEQYRSLVHAAAEGLLFVRNGLCSYGNPVMLKLIGCNEKELCLIEWSELFSELVSEPEDASKYYDSGLKRLDGTVIPCTIRITGDNRFNDSFVCIVRRKENQSEFLQISSGNVLQRILKLPATIAKDIAREIYAAKDPEEVIELCRRTPELAVAMLAGGANTLAVTRSVTAITDAATRRFIELKQNEIGKEPVPFAFIVLGSQGRNEQTLFTDQDNAIIYHDDGSGNNQVEDYFNELAQSVCGNLARSGYRPCGGKIMAENRKWCQSLNVWKSYFSNWIGRTEPKDIMELNTFLDLRCLTGQEQMVKELKTHIFSEIERSPQFFLFIANESLNFKVPLGIFADKILDLKSAMMPVVNYARIFALKYSIDAVSTTERLTALFDNGFLNKQQHHDIITVFESLLRLRLNHQAATIENGQEPDNLIDPSLLGSMDTAVLKECFKEIEIFQEHIKRAFMGGADRIV